MDGLTPPKPLIVKGNLVENWKRWIQDFTFYLTGTEYTKNPNQVKSSLLLHCIGEKGQEIYNDFPFDNEEDTLVYDKIIEKFKANIAPRKNLTYFRFKFLTYQQEEGQSFESFFRYLKKFSSDCELDHLKESLIRDMIIIGGHHEKLEKRLLREINLTLDRTVKICQTIELTRSYAKVIQQGTSYSSDYNVDAIRRNRKDFEQSSKQKIIMNCKFCSYTHKRGSCPAYDKLCNSCHKKGHFSKCCVNFKRHDIKQINIDKNKFHDSDDEYLFVHTCGY